jgi:hypothetical protein
MPKISFEAYLHIPVSKAEEGNYESYNLQGVYLLISVQRFQRRRFKCEKLTDGRTDGRTTDAYP